MNFAEFWEFGRLAVGWPVKGSQKGQDEGPEEGLFGETTQIKFILSKGIWKTDCSPKSRHVVELYESKSIFYRTPKWSV